MENLKMQSGIFGAAHQNTVALQKLLLCFLATYLRQMLSKCLLFMYHNGSEDETTFMNALQLSLKYSTLSPNGIAFILRPYLHLAYEQGYLQEEDCEGNEFAARTLALFTQIHNVWECQGEAQARTWMLTYVYEILSDAQVATEEALLAGDISQEELNEEASDNDEEMVEDDEMVEDEGMEDSIEECTCDFCEEMRTLDTLDIDQVDSTDPIDQIIIHGMKGALTKGAQAPL
jgi:hypothetical protein